MSPTPSIPKRSNNHCSISPVSGFTLVELLVVIIIIATLAALSFVGFSTMKRSANSAMAVQSLRQVGAGVLGLASELGGKLPNEGHYPGQGPKDNPYTDDLSWDGAVLKYLGESDLQGTPPQVSVSYESMFWHRNDIKPPVTGANTPTARRSFGYIRSLSDLPISKVDDPTRTAMLAEVPWVANNRVGFKSASFASISSLVKDPKTGKDLNPGGKFNFVFIDGHVETLTKNASCGKGSTTNPGGLWTILATD